MMEETRKYLITFPRPKAKGVSKKLFIELVKEHVAKARKGDDPDLSKKVDEVVYGI